MSNLILMLMAREIRNSSVNGVASVASTQCTNDQQWTKYHSKQGHGFAAEDANTMWERWHGKSVNKVGLDNSLNGADRISDGVQIQTKYCADAGKSLGAAFENGTYRYGGMKIEVPSDQYEEAVRIMRGRISNGEVPGVTDPNMADQIVIKGHYTYDEAVRIAKAGNLDSIKFDIQTQAVACAFACGLSFAVTYCSAKSQGVSHTEALKIASKQAAKSGATTMVTGVAAQQLLRTEVGRNFAAVATKAIKPAVQAAMKSELGKQVVAKTATAIAGKQVAGAAAANVLTKALRTNAVVSTVVFVGTTIPDAVNLCRGKISGAEFAENTTTNAAGVGGGWAGASAGAAVGSMICPGVGTVIGGIVGGIGGGMGASLGVKKVIGWFK
ncbi:MAG: hypothetical protein MR299_07055 [Bacteroidales bacterium]|nr:hypothetical protein [Bacteroidales bacterium]